MISYNGIWSELSKRGISQYTLINVYGVSPGIITRLKRNQSVSTDTLNKICDFLKCELSDLVTYIPGDGNTQQEDPG